MENEKENENEKKTKTLEDIMDSVADLLAESAGAAEKVADLEKRLSKNAENAAQMAKRIASQETENEGLRKDLASLRKLRGEANAMLNGIVLDIAKLKCRNPSIN